MQHTKSVHAEALLYEQIIFWIVNVDLHKLFAGLIREIREWHVTLPAALAAGECHLSGHSPYPRQILRDRIRHRSNRDAHCFSYCLDRQ